MQKLVSTTTFTFYLIKPENAGSLLIVLVVLTLTFFIQGLNTSFTSSTGPRVVETLHQHVNHTTPARSAHTFIEVGERLQRAASSAASFYFPLGV